MELFIPAPSWAQMRWQADQRGTFCINGITYTLTGERCGPWSSDAPPYIEGCSEAGAFVRALQALPIKRLDAARAQQANKRLAQRGWRKRFFEGEVPEWGTLQGHPVAVYWDLDGRRWAALLYETDRGCCDEIMIDRQQMLDGQYKHVQAQPEQLELCFFE